VIFVKMPIPRKDLNRPFTREQLEKADFFVDELITLRVFELVPEGSTLVNTCPIFLVSTPGQPGQG
jgi:hypothetical protein